MIELDYYARSLIGLKHLRYFSLSWTLAHAYVTARAGKSAGMHEITDTTRALIG